MSHGLADCHGELEEELMEGCPQIRWVCSHCLSRSGVLWSQMRIETCSSPCDRISALLQQGAEPQ